MQLRVVYKNLNKSYTIRWSAGYSWAVEVRSKKSLSSVGEVDEIINLKENSALKQIIVNNVAIIYDLAN
jgi:hypothetical protein